jgi:hypothetical protein
VGAGPVAQKLVGVLLRSFPRKRESSRVCGALRLEEQKTLGKLNNCRHRIGRRSGKDIEPRKFEAKSYLISCDSSQKNKNKEAPTLIQIGEKSGTLTPFGSLGGASHSVGSDDSAHRRTVYRRSDSIKLAWGWICNLFQAVWQHAAFKTH